MKGLRREPQGTSSVHSGGTFLRIMPRYILMSEKPHVTCRRVTDAMIGDRAVDGHSHTTRNATQPSASGVSRS